VRALLKQGRTNDGGWVPVIRVRFGNNSTLQTKEPQMVLVTDHWVHYYYLKSLCDLLRPHYKSRVLTANTRNSHHREGWRLRTQPRNFP